MSAGHTGVTAQASCVDAHPGCEMREVLDRIGDKWSVMVIAELVHGTRRFGELRRGVEGISQRMLTLTVRRLERDGLLRRTVVAAVPVQVYYELTDLGLGLAHLVGALVDWSTTHRAVVAASRAAWDAANPDSVIR